MSYKAGEKKDRVGTSEDCFRTENPREEDGDKSFVRKDKEVVGLCLDLIKRPLVFSKYFCLALSIVVYAR